ncbi:hypothetical protein [Niallia taxi]|nr:hypothetical protein [Niallia taxi]
MEKESQDLLVKMNKLLEQMDKRLDSLQNKLDKIESNQKEFIKSLKD